MSNAAARKVNAPIEIAKSIAEKSAEIIYVRFPKIAAVEEADRKYFATFVTAVSGLGFLTLLFINTLLAQDAIALSNLKLEAKHVADQRDAINRLIDAHSAPDALAAAATSLGMKPSESPIFLNINPDESGVTRG